MTLAPRLSPGPVAALALALGGLVVDAAPARAAWDNVFQVCCHDCNRRASSFYSPAPAVSYYAPAPAVSYYAPAPSVSYASPVADACAPACPAPQPEVRVSYVQRCYYQPVTEYQRQSYYEPVTKKVTSYYMEPVQSYQYTTYYDPCTGCPQKVCRPVTSYRMRSQCNSVTSYVERCAMVPVTSLKPVTVRQPVVSYYYPPAPACDSCSAPLAAAPAAPTVDQIRSAPPSVMPPATEGATIPPTTVPTTPGGVSSPRVPQPSNVRLRPERTVSRGPHAVRGEIVLNDGVTPRPGTKVVFVSADDQTKRQYATANAYGEFDAAVPAGKWFVYVGGEGGRATFHKQVTIGDRDTYDYRLVSR